MPWPASAPISIRSVPGSNNLSNRSRAVHLPLALLFNAFEASSLSHLIQDAFQVRRRMRMRSSLRFCASCLSFAMTRRYAEVLPLVSCLDTSSRFKMVVPGRCSLPQLSTCSQGEADQTGFIHPSHAHGFAWATSDQGQTTLIIHQPRTGKAIATVSATKLATESTLVRTFRTSPSIAPEAS